MDDAEAGKENTLKANPKDIAEQYETRVQGSHAGAQVPKKLQRHLDSTDD